MNILRKFILFIVSTFLVSTLVATATAWTIRSTIADRETVKSWLLVSGVYDNFVDEVVAATAAQAQESEDAASIDVATLTNSARAAFPPALLQNSLEAVLDGSYNWLEGESESIDFSVDFSEAKNLFASEIALAVKIKADSLPTCEPNEIPVTLDVFDSSCLPDGTDTQLLADEFETAILTNEELLSDPVITGESIQVNKGGDRLPIADAYPSVATWYQRALWLPGALSIISVISVLFVLFLSDTKRKGVLTLVKAFTFASLSTGLTAVIARLTPLSAGELSGGGEAATGFAERILLPFAQEAIDDFVFWSVQFVVLYGALMLSCAVYLLLTYQRKQAKDSQHKTPALEQQANLPEK